MKRVLALDPGDRVGYARADVNDDGTWENLEHGITPLKQCALEVHAALTSGDADWITPKYDLIVMERWALYGHMASKMVGSEIPSAQFIGMVKLSAWLAGVPVVMQNARDVNSNRPGVLAPAEAHMKRFNPELFALVTQPGAHDEQHDLVAIKHLYYYTHLKRTQP